MHTRWIDKFEVTGRMWAAGLLGSPSCSTSPSSTRPRVLVESNPLEPDLTPIPSPDSHTQFGRQFDVLALVWVMAAPEVDYCHHGNRDRALHRSHSTSSRRRSCLAPFPPLASSLLSSRGLQHRGGGKRLGMPSLGQKKKIMTGGSPSSFCLKNHSG